MEIWKLKPKNKNKNKNKNKRNKLRFFASTSLLEIYVFNWILLAFHRIRPIFNLWPTVVLSQFVNATESAHGSCDMSAGCEAKAYNGGVASYTSPTREIKGGKKENYLWLWIWSSFMNILFLRNIFCNFLFKVFILVWF